MIDEEIEFGYSLRMSKDDKTANIQIRYDKIITRIILAECLRSLAEEIEQGSTREEECDA